MRISEGRLRQIIREVIVESMDRVDDNTEFAGTGLTYDDLYSRYYINHREPDIKDPNYVSHIDAVRGGDPKASTYYKSWRGKLKDLIRMHTGIYPTVDELLKLNAYCKERYAKEDRGSAGTREFMRKNRGAKTGQGQIHPNQLEMMHDMSGLDDDV